MLGQTVLQEICGLGLTKHPGFTVNDRGSLICKWDDCSKRRQATAERFLRVNNRHVISDNAQIHQSPREHKPEHQSSGSGLFAMQTEEDDGCAEHDEQNHCPGPAEYSVLEQDVDHGWRKLVRLEKHVHL